MHSFCKPLNTFSLIKTHLVNTSGKVKGIYNTVVINVHRTTQTCPHLFFNDVIKPAVQNWSQHRWHRFTEMLIPTMDGSGWGWGRARCGVLSRLDLTHLGFCFPFAWQNTTLPVMWTKSSSWSQKWSVETGWVNDVKAMHRLILRTGEMVLSWMFDFARRGFAEWRFAFNMPVFWRSTDFVKECQTFFPKSDTCDIQTFLSCQAQTSPFEPTT